MATLKETAEKLRLKLNEISSFPEVKIPSFLKKEIGNLILKQNNTKTFFNENSFYVETSLKHYAIVPNQFIYLAVECYELVVKLRILFDFFDKVIRNNDYLKKKINNIQDKISKGQNVDIISEIGEIDFSSYSDVNADDFSFLIGNLKDCKKFGNVDKNSLRSSEDLLGAYVLNIVPLTTAASGYFGTLVYALSSDLSLYKKLCESITIIHSDLKESSISYFSPTQTIYYGVPGSGKSHKIDEQTKNIPDEQKIRVVFHPEYTNADFVGQILPVVDGDAVKYTFKPGTFTRILVAALKNPEKPYYLIIEEINRGNAAAIFGEIFQLLDRGSDGWSSYCIMNDDINYEIRKTVPELNWTANTGIRLPPNLSLFATMNTSDQNVFTLDNAFQRRWEMELVQNQCNDSSQMDAKITVNNQSITWKNFQTQINSIIGEKSNEGGLSSMEDKRIGCWFIKAENNAINEKKFANKVLKYLWDDAFKFYHQEIFESDIKNFEELQKRFFEKGFDVFSENCGLKDFLSTSQPDSESKSETTTPQDSESQSENSEQ